MHNRIRVLALLLATILALPTTASAQDDMEPVTISIYHVAPGQHMAFLEWMAEREEIAAEVGAPDTQWYTHLNGDSWDYLGIALATTDAQDDAMEAMARERGLTAGPAAGMELRTMIASHTDTEAAGPMTAPEILDSIRGEEAARSGSVSEGASIEGDWRLLSMGAVRDQSPVTRGTDITLTFESDRVSGSGGCNRYFANYTMGANGILSIGPVGATRMACPQPAMGQETQYLEMLGKAARVDREGAVLNVYSRDGDLLQFRQM